MRSNRVGWDQWGMRAWEAGPRICGAGQEAGDSKTQSMSAVQSGRRRMPTGSRSRSTMVIWVKGQKRGPLNQKKDGESHLPGAYAERRAMVGGRNGRRVLSGVLDCGSPFAEGRFASLSLKSKYCIDQSQAQVSTDTPHVYATSGGLFPDPRRGRGT